jgi:hypothetical protein
VRSLPFIPQSTAIRDYASASGGQWRDIDLYHTPKAVGSHTYVKKVRLSSGRESSRRKAISSPWRFLMFRTSICPQNPKTRFCSRISDLRQMSSNYWLFSQQRSHWAFKILIKWLCQSVQLESESPSILLDKLSAGFPSRTERFNGLIRHMLEYDLKERWTLENCLQMLSHPVHCLLREFHQSKLRGQRWVTGLRE